MNLKDILNILTPSILRRGRQAKNRLNEATRENRKVVAEARRQLRHSKLSLERAIILNDVRDVDEQFDRGHSQ